MTQCNWMRALVLGAVASAALTAPVAAQNRMCGERALVLDRLSGHFGETRRGMGLGANNGIVEVFASDDTGTWTITVTMPNGTMCLVASGQAYDDAMDTLASAQDEGA